jgi:formylglycine-generating enzyme required for sulfatase activity
MAPEQLSTKYGRENQQVDIWGFGVTMYQLLTGQFPFLNKDQIRDKREKPYEMAGVSRRTRDLVMKCLEKDRKKRFQNMEEVLKVLGSIAKGKAKVEIKKKAEIKVKEKEPSWKKWGLLTAAMIVFIVLAVILLPPKKETPVKKQDAVPNQIDESKVKEEEEFKKYLSQANIHFKNGDIEKAREKLNLAIKIMKTKETESLNLQFREFERMPAPVREIVLDGISVNGNDKGYWEAKYDDGIIMVYIPPGQFKMGSNDPDAYDSEKPQHTVALDGYWIGKYEVTFSQYDRYCDEKGKKKPSDEGWGRGKRPVINVSWDEANKYCQWLSEKTKKTGLSFKLPTEAQWEKAARGTGSRKYPWGNNEPDKTLANFFSNVGKTTPVGSYPKGASLYGLLDMAGNVWEWCRDWYDGKYYHSSPEKNPTGPKSGTYRVVRGGSWGLSARYLRCSYRYYIRPSGRSDGLGFRRRQDN